MPERYIVNSRVFLCLTFLLLVFPGGWVVSVPYAKIHKQFDVVVNIRSILLLFLFNKCGINSGLTLRVRNENLILLFLNQNICCRYSKEPSQ